MPSQASALALLGLVGIANAILDVAFFSILGRLVPDELLGRVFGVIESGVALSVGIGALVTPLAISLVGLRGALAVLGAVCPAMAVVALRRLRRLDRTLETYAAMIDVLRRAPMLHVLPATTIEQLARHAERVSIQPGTAIRVQGEVGDGFYVIESGEVEVTGDGALLRTLGAGDSFGEVALLRDVPSTATVVARSSTTGWRASPDRPIDPT